METSESRALIRADEASNEEEFFDDPFLSGETDYEIAVDKESDIPFPSVISVKLKGVEDIVVSGHDIDSLQADSGDGEAEGPRPQIPRRQSALPLLAPSPSEARSQIEGEGGFLEDEDGSSYNYSELRSPHRPEELTISSTTSSRGRICSSPKRPASGSYSPCERGDSSPSERPSQLALPSPCAPSSTSVTTQPAPPAASRLKINTGPMKKPIKTLTTVHGKVSPMSTDLSSFLPWGGAGAGTAHANDGGDRGDLAYRKPYRKRGLLGTVRSAVLCCCPGLDRAARAGDGEEVAQDKVQGPSNTSSTRFSMKDLSYTSLKAKLRSWNLSLHNSFYARQLFFITLGILSLSSSSLLILYLTDNGFSRGELQHACVAVHELWTLIYYISYGNFVFGLASIGAAPFLLIKPDVESRSIVRTPFLEACELFLVVEVLYLTFWTITALLGPFLNYGIATCVQNRRAIVLFTHFLGAIIYVLIWKQLNVFNLYKTHLELQFSAFGFQMRDSDVRLVDRLHYIITKLDCLSVKRRNKKWLKRSLYLAAQSGDVELTEKILLQARELVGPNFVQEMYSPPRYTSILYLFSTRNPLHAAAASGHVQVAEVLVEAGFNCNTLDAVRSVGLNLRSLYSWIFHTFFIMRWTRAKGLRHRGVLQDPFILSAESPLHVAAANGQVHMVNWLIENGANVDLPSSSVMAHRCVPPLFVAESSQVVKALLNHGANPLFVPFYGCYMTLTVLDQVYLQENHTLYRLLEEWGADVALTPLHSAVGNRLNEELEKLLKMGVDPNTTGDLSFSGGKRTPLHWAAIIGNYYAASRLLHYGAEAEIEDYGGRTPLHWAARRGNLPIVKILLAAGADPSHRDRMRMTPILAAAESENISAEVLGELIKAGGDVHATCPNGDTALHVALRLENRATAMSLLRNGADIMRTNNQGERAIDCTTSTELQFAVKREAGSRDVMISYAHANSELALHIRRCLEAANITTWMDILDPTGIGGGAVWREEIARGIENAALVLCILSEQYQKSQWCLKELAFAKHVGTPVLAISCDNVQLSDELQVYVYTRQIIPFQDAVLNRSHICSSEQGLENTLCLNEDKFDRNMRLLIDGARDEIEKARMRRRKKSDTSSSTNEGEHKPLPRSYARGRADSDHTDGASAPGATPSTPAGALQRGAGSRKMLQIAQKYGGSKRNAVEKSGSGLRLAQGESVPGMGNSSTDTGSRRDNDSSSCIGNHNDKSSDNTITTTTNDNHNHTNNNSNNEDDDEGNNNSMDGAVVRETNGPLPSEKILSRSESAQSYMHSKRVGRAFTSLSSWRLGGGGRSSKEVLHHSIDDTRSRDSAATVCSTFSSDMPVYHSMAFVSHGDCHPRFVRSLSKQLRASGINCVVDSGTSTADMKERILAAKDAILKSNFVVVILSAQSARTELVSDQLAFAEDKRKEIVPVLLANHKLDAGKIYTISRSKVFHFSEMFDFESSYRRLHKHLQRLADESSRQKRTSFVADDGQSERNMETASSRTAVSPCIPGSTLSSLGQWDSWESCAGREQASERRDSSTGPQLTNEMLSQLQCSVAPSFSPSSPFSYYSGSSRGGGSLVSVSSSTSSSKRSLSVVNHNSIIATSLASASNTGSPVRNGTQHCSSMTSVNSAVSAGRVTSYQLGNGSGEDGASGGRRGGCTRENGGDRCCGERCSEKCGGQGGGSHEGCAAGNVCCCRGSSDNGNNVINNNNSRSSINSNNNSNGHNSNNYNANNFNNHNFYNNDCTNPYLYCGYDDGSLRHPMIADVYNRERANSNVSASSRLSNFSNFSYEYSPGPKEL